MHLVNHLVIVYHSRDSDDIICDSVTRDATSYTISDLNATGVYIIHIDIVLNNGSTIMTSEVTLKQKATDGKRNVESKEPIKNQLL